MFNDINNINQEQADQYFTITEINLEELTNGLNRTFKFDPIIVKEEVEITDYIEEKPEANEILHEDKRYNNIDNTGCKIPVKCNICHKVFINKHRLYMHEVIHMPGKPFKCEICEKSFKLKKSRDRHQSLHAGVRPFKCDICEKSFKLNNNLIMHKLVHMEKRPFKCNICEKTFKFKNNLDSHTFTHSDERNFKCKFCKKAFKSFEGRSHHTRRAHF